VLAPPELTLATTVSPSNTMDFLAVGIGLNIPLILFYNWFAHHAFSGKLNRAPTNGRHVSPAGSGQ
jgi:cytochrome d ubiquinol oxidase subunit II